ncbi:cytochrome P450 [Lophiotrema nucula]|uniref:Cytochrome P450 n=1 Tax=Lophiotrema nucula TaxID=690887 RepID=A0A6A5YL95_9PLEO|nr:cytochrome P450 [Lophiotrema nucula]
MFRALRRPRLRKHSIRLLCTITRKRHLEERRSILGALAPIFHRPNPLPAFDVLEKHVQILLNAIRATARTSSDAHRDIDLRPPLREFSLSAAAETLLGVSFQSNDTDESRISQDFEDFTNAFRNAIKYTSRREKLKAFYWLLNSKTYRHPCNTAHAALGRIMASLPRPSYKSKRFANSTTTPYQDIAWNLRGDDTVADQILNLLFASRDTTSSLTNWVFYLVAREPEAFGEAWAQIVSILGADASTIPTDEQLSKLTVLDHILYESRSSFAWAFRVLYWLGAILFGAQPSRNSLPFPNTLASCSVGLMNIYEYLGRCKSYKT